MLDADGVIAIDGRIHRITLLTTLLVMDVDKYAVRLRDHLETLAADDADADYDDLAACERQRVQEITKWLQTHEGMTRSLPHLAEQQALLPHTVECGDLVTYLNRVIQIAEPTPSNRPAKIEFILFGDGKCRILMATSRDRAVVAATGKCLTGTISDDGHGLFARCADGIGDEELYSLLQQHCDRVCGIWKGLQ